MALSQDMQCKIFKLYIEGQTAYAISEELKINYRTAKKYTAAIDLILNKIKTSVAYCILRQMEQKTENLTE
jgi:DNA-binding CsgD family transcriptional regulator